MVVALSFHNGRVHLRSRFVATKERVEEQSQRQFIYRGQMGTHPNSPLKDTAILIKNWLSLRWPKLQYRNPSNTNVFYWGGKVCLLLSFKYIRKLSDVVVSNHKEPEWTLASLILLNYCWPTDIKEFSLSI